MLRAAGYIWPILTLALVFEILIAATLFHLIKVSSGYNPIPQWLLALLVGILLVLLPTTFEYFVLFKNADEEKVKNPLVKLALILNLAIVHKFGSAIRTRMEQDTYECQTGWSIEGIDDEELYRRFRKIYSCHMLEIARKNRDPELLRRDVGFHPLGHFYLLAEHLGRKKLREELTNPPPMKWDGKERRRRKERNPKDRAMQEANDQKTLYTRCYDDEDLRKRISAGKD